MIAVVIVWIDWCLVVKYELVYCEEFKQEHEDEEDRGATAGRGFI